MLNMSARSIHRTKNIHQLLFATQPGSLRWGQWYEGHPSCIFYLSLRLQMVVGNKTISSQRFGPLGTVSCTVSFGSDVWSAYWTAKTTAGFLCWLLVGKISLVCHHWYRLSGFWISHCCLFHGLPMDSLLSYTSAGIWCFKIFHACHLFRYMRM